ncbi:MAG: capsule assembly Wzi family protein [Gemmatimonadota bacterium]|nr:capsule assembly Wzi family protein [Gemmatimonadota bacterium]
MLPISSDSRSALMLGIRSLGLVVPLGLMVVGGHAASAQTSTDLPPGAREEWAVEKLVGFGLIDDRVFAVRPWSRGEVARLLGLARERLPGLGDEEREAAEAILATVAGRDLAARLRLEGIIGGSLLDSPWLPVPEDTGMGAIDAEVNHLVRYRGGRDYVDGQMLGGELALDGVLGDHLAAQVQPRLWVGRGAGAGLDGGQLVRGHARLQRSNLRLDVGRSSSVWGPGRDGGTLLAGNAPGLDRIRVSSDSPFRWPGFLSALGPTQAEVFIALLEERRDIPRSKLVGYNVSIRPHPLVEAWFATLIQSGGRGSPTAGAWERIADHLLFIDWIFNGGETFLFSNKGTSLGMRVRVPRLRHSQLFAEFTLEDKGHNPRRIFWQDGAWLVGVWVPRLDAVGTHDLRVELHHSGYRMHRHGQFTSGRTVDRRLLGMGDVNSDGGFVEVATNRRGLRFSLQLGVENRSADVWDTRFRADGELDFLEKVDDRPDELYLRGLASVRAFGDGGRELVVGIGLARVSDSRFVEGAVRHDGILEISGRVPILSRD